MGKWATYQKRGSAPQQGLYAGPPSGGWSLGTLTATTIPVNRLAGQPGGTDAWIARAVDAADGSVYTVGPGSGTPQTITGLTTLHTYRVQIAWTSGGNQVSEWSDVKTAVLP